MEWISVKDRLPKDENDVLVAHEHFTFVGVQLTVCNYEKNGKWYDYRGHEVSDNNKITHWMPLPEPPKSSSKVINLEPC